MHIHNKTVLFTYVPFIHKFFHNLRPVLKISRDYHRAANTGLKAVCKPVRVAVGCLYIKRASYIKIFFTKILAFAAVKLFTPFCYGFRALEHWQKFSHVFGNWYILTVSHHGFLFLPCLRNDCKSAAPSFLSLSTI